MILASKLYSRLLIKLNGDFICISSGNVVNFQSVKLSSKNAFPPDTSIIKHIGIASYNNLNLPFGDLVSLG